jgi:hypothetical protein
MGKFIKRSVIIVAVFLVVIQVIRPARTNPPIDPARTIEARTQMPEEVGMLFDMSCSDCHSYETKWPWYSKVAPISWLIWSDVQEGRSRLNLSDWAQYDSRRAKDKLGFIEKMVSKGDMPLWQYRMMHKEARLSPSDVKTLVEWTRAERARMAAKP